MVCHIRPCSPPQNKLLVAVPAFRDGILPAIFGAFRIFGYPFIALRLRCGRGHIHLLFAHFVLVLFLPAVGLCRLNSAAVKPRSSPSLTQRYSFSVLYCHFPFSSSGRTVSRIWAWGLCPGGYGSWIAASAHIPSATNCSLMKSCRSWICSSRLSSMGSAATNHGQGDCPLRFRFPPQRSTGFPDLPLCGGGGWQKNLPPPKALFAGVVMLHPVILVEHPGTAQIGRSSHGRAPDSTTDHLGLQMINCHKSPCPF